ncbi:NPHP3 [Acanthosepion pharaonis]|uniref:NPHP3 n=1 Tax=Acanthosepion pharaonis TaxID=158019 RepID=A0A812AW58_ACAPH|nr:NPHP3 [Sepia pharaonis]
MNDSKPVGAVYLIRSGHKSNVFEQTFIKGHDLWEFSVDSNGYLFVKGCIDSIYTVYHNRKNHRPATDVSGQALSYFSDNCDGSAGTTILNVCPIGKHAALIVFCSHSCGPEDATSASLYFIVLADKTAHVHLLAESYGEGCIHREQWTFKVDPENCNLRVFGPSGPCRFATITNISENLLNNSDRHFITASCLVPGAPANFKGNTKITPEEILVTVSDKCAINLFVNCLFLCRIPSEELIASDSKWIYKRSWLDDEIGIGIALVQVFADLSDDGSTQIELTGSPHQIIRQPKGVITSVNCGGPSFHSLEDDIVYISEHSRFASFSYDFNFGTRSKCLGGIKINTSFQQQITGSRDGFLYTTSRSPRVEAIDEQTVTYTIDKIPNGNFKVRLHCLAQNCGRITINDVYVSPQIHKEFSLQTEISAGYHAHTADVPVTVSENQLNICSKDTALCAFALLDEDFPCNKSSRSKEERNALKEETVKLTESVAPIARTLLKKKMKIIGWSQNLLQNASGEQNSLVHWNPYGDWGIHEGGYGTEKAFKTSYMKCTKQQEVDLTDYFSSEYLDSVPEIQVSEWYREGVCGGGYYSMTATLMDENGTVIKKYTSGEIGKIYQDNKWMEASVIFSDYGPGVRCVSLESSGKDDKYWKGHYGPLMSAAMIRVKRQSQSAVDDVYSDIDLSAWQTSENSSQLDEFLTKSFCHSFILSVILLFFSEFSYSFYYSFILFDILLFYSSFFYSFCHPFILFDILLFNLSFLYSFHHSFIIFVILLFFCHSFILFIILLFFRYTFILFFILLFFLLSFVLFIILLLFSSFFYSFVILLFFLSFLYSFCHSFILFIILLLFFLLFFCHSFILLIFHDSFNLYVILLLFFFHSCHHSFILLFFTSFIYSFRHSFISFFSTFRDFTQEREELIKKTFQEINRKCLERGIFFTYVDLRWGISKEQTDDGKTVAICLKEIDRCRPYFVCLLGNRFGWSQKMDKTDELLNGSINYAIASDGNFAWIEEHRYGSSVTQLEIYHGVLNDVPNRKDRSSFYLRQPLVANEMNGEDFKVYEAESTWHHERQQSLRETIKQTPGLNVKEYKTKDEVCKYIKKDVIQWLESDFPKGSELSRLEIQREAHEAFADARCRVYIGGEKYFQMIDTLMTTTKRQPVVILGQSGSGKSALIANWCSRIMAEEPETFFFVHFIGSSSESASYLKMLYRLYEELKDFFGFDLEVPSSDTAIVQDLSQWLQMAASIKKCVVVFDALNQLDDGSGIGGPEQDLRWIPDPLPSDNVKILMSTLPGKAMDSVKRFQWPTLKVEPLNTEEKGEIITEFFEKIYGKTLSSDQRELIKNSPQTDNPLYLRTLLDEIRMYGSFFTLTEKITEYLNADSPKSLFTKILARLEEDYADQKFVNYRIGHLFILFSK